MSIRMDIPTIPPGFESLAPFNVEKLEDHEVSISSTAACASEARTVQLETDFHSNDDIKFPKSCRRRSWAKYNQSESSSGDESAAEQHMFLGNKLPKGVTRGCEKCSSCQKVTAKWRPEEGRRPDLLEAPVFYPSEEEFEDTLKYIASIRPKAEMYGICRIVPPLSWKPPCPLKEKNMWESSKFNTRVQRIEKLQNRNSMRKTSQTYCNKRRKKRKCINTDVGQRNIDEDHKIAREVEVNEVDERFGFEHGPEFTMDEFKKYADDFKAQYFSKNLNNLDPGRSRNMLEEQCYPEIESIEAEYWRMVEKPTEEIEVLYGADLETQVFGSGFPTKSAKLGSDSYMKYINSGWNLNNISRLPGSVLSFESSDISGVLIPWLYIGMCLSSFCWHVEDHHLYSLNYMHWGDPKMWYGVPGSDAVKLEAAMKKHLPDLFEEQPDLLHKLVTQLSPSILKSEGVPVYRCVQNPGEFVLTFPRAYHAGFNCGFNCAEAVNVAPIDWLPHGNNAVEIYREQGRKTTISHDKLLLGAAREAVKANWEYNLLRKYTPNNLRWKDVCGKDGILSRALKTRVEVERRHRDFLNKSSQALKMESSFDANSERECSACLFDLHMSAAGCHRCSPEKYACLNHAKELCSCSWGAKFFLFRYDVGELNLLVEALEGKLSAIYRWARLDLGLALSSYVSKDNMRTPGIIGTSSHISLESAPKEMNSLPTPTMVSSKQRREQVEQESLNSIKCTVSISSSQRENPSAVVLALETVKPSSNCSSSENKSLKGTSSRIKENNSQSVPDFKIVTRLPSQVHSPNASSTKKLAIEDPEVKQLTVRGIKNVILVNDEEEDEADKKIVENSGPHSGNTSNSVSPSDGVTPLSFKASFTGDISHHDRLKNGSSSVPLKIEDHEVVNTNLDEDSKSIPISKALSAEADSYENMSTKKDILECNDADTHCSIKSRNIDSDHYKKLELDFDSVSNTLQTVSSNPVSLHNNLDRYYRQKGPRMAKVVRRINCNVELLNLGFVQAGKKWCDSRAIYPKGFRTRVRYIDAVDPAKMSYYVSEILDARKDGPLFMVSLEHCPSEIFVHITASRCWEMVRERVNLEIAKQHKLGREKLSPLQPPGSLDGMEMFGFSSPEIVQAIQAMDQNHICSVYWKSRPLIQIPQHPPPGESSGNHVLKSEPWNDQEMERNNPGAVRILGGLFKKASLEELHTLNNLLHKENSTDMQRLLTELLNDEIHKGGR